MVLIGIFSEFLISLAETRSSSSLHSQAPKAVSRMVKDYPVKAQYVVTRTGGSRKQASCSMPSRERLLVFYFKTQRLATCYPHSRRGVCAVNSDEVE